MARIRKNGFTLIELLLVLGLIGIISMIAIPSFMGQRRRARLIGDAKANAQVMAMQLETQRADLGIYGLADAKYGWTTDATLPSGFNAPPASFLPSFSPKGNSKMKFGVAIGSTGISYTISVFDPAVSNTAAIMTLNQAGSVWSKY